MKKALPYLLITAFILLALGAAVYQKINPPVPTPTKQYTTQKATLLRHDYAKELSETDETTRDETVYAVLLERPLYWEADRTQAAEFMFFDIYNDICTMGSSGTTYKTAKLSDLCPSVLEYASALREKSDFELCVNKDYKVPGESDGSDRRQDEYNVYIVTGTGVYLCVFTSATVPSELTEYFTQAEAAILNGQTDTTAEIITETNE